MAKIRVILVLIVFAFVASTVWQVASCEIANYELKDDLKDIASMGGARIGLAAQQLDDDLRATVIRKAAGHAIVLAAEQIMVKRSGTVEAPAELKNELAKSKKARDRWEKLAFTHKKEMAISIRDAKHEETKKRRLAKVVQVLKTGARWTG